MSENNKDLVNDLIRAFDDEHGLPSPAYEAVCELLLLTYGEVGNQVFRDAVKSQDGRYYLPEGTGNATVQAVQKAYACPPLVWRVVVTWTETAVCEVPRSLATSLEAAKELVLDDPAEYTPEHGDYVEDSLGIDHECTAEFNEDGD